MIPHIALTSANPRCDEQNSTSSELMTVIDQRTRN
jgi:hypothetical protein